MLPPTAMSSRRVDDRVVRSRHDLERAQEVFRQHLKKVGLKETGQRAAILRAFLESREHLSAEELHRRARRKDRRVGVTTVYRTLKLLAECGLAGEVAFPDGVARFEPRFRRRGHHHMICTGCGASVEFFSPEVERLEREVGARHGFVTTRHSFQVYGICRDCRRREKLRD